MSEPVQILYVIGAGRSGSTLLDMVLDLHPELTGLGELTNLPLLAWQRAEYCSCGETGDVCPFWTRVREAWLATPGVVSVDHFLARKSNIERYSRIPKLLGMRATNPSDEFLDYAHHTRTLFEVIRAETGARILVDSSKHVGRGLALSLIDGLEISYVHLVRDVRGVAWSLRKPYAKDMRGGIQKDMPGRRIARTAAFWTFTNSVTAALLPHLSDRTMRLRYEDFVSDPAATLHRLGELGGFDPTALAELVAGEFQTRGDRHTIAGNRLRMKRSLRIKQDTSWRENLGAGDRAIIAAIAGGLMRAYGYRAIR